MPTARDALHAHLALELGEWPPLSALSVTTSATRATAGWDGVIRRITGVQTPQGAVLSVPAELVEATRKVTADEVSLQRARPALEELLGGTLGEAAFRWCEEPEDLKPIGQWVPVGDPGLPDWLLPFGGEALVVRDDQGQYLAGIGLKRHNDFCREIAVGTEDAARGQGLARRLVATAARHILDHGMVPLYFHALDNEASARVADAAGFPDRNWRLLFFLPHTAATTD